MVNDIIRQAPSGALNGATLRRRSHCYGKRLPRNDISRDLNDIVQSHQPPARPVCARGCVIVVITAIIVDPPSVTSPIPLHPSLQSGRRKTRSFVRLQCLTTRLQTRFPQSELLQALKFNASSFRQLKGCAKGSDTWKYFSTRKTQIYVYAFYWCSVLITRGTRFLFKDTFRRAPGGGKRVAVFTSPIFLAIYRDFVVCHMQIKPRRNGRRERKARSVPGGRMGQTSWKETLLLSRSSSRDLLWAT